MTENKLLTIEDILKKKELIKNENKNYFSKYFGLEIEIINANPSSVLDILNSGEDQYRQYLQLIYLCCPMFKSEELHEKFEIKEPYEIIEQVFNHRMAEIMALGNFILEGLGYFDGGLIEEIKK